MTDVIELYIIELPKVEKYSKNNKLDTWVKFIMNVRDIDMENMDEELKEARKVLDDINSSEYEQYLAHLREKYILDMNSIEDGGIEKGIKKERIEIAKKMKKKGIEDNLIMEITELTKGEIENL